MSGAARRRRGILLSTVLGVALALPGTASGADGQERPLGEAELRGKEVFRRGTSPSGGEIFAVMGVDGAPIPAAVLPCAGCHGSDGRGRPEGGVVPPELTWRHLTRPDGVRLASGRERPPYTEKLLVRAVGLGFDAGGTELERAMPRYRMSHGDMADLVAYLRRLGDEPVAGVASSALRLGTVLPPGAGGDAIESLLEARFAEHGARGGVYGRKIELVTRRLDEAAPTPAEALRELLEGGDVFALVAPALAGFEEEAAAIAAEHEVPIVGPFAAHPERAAAHQHWFFFLDGGLVDQARALVARAAERYPELPPALLLHPPDSDRAAVDEALDTAAAIGWSGLESFAWGAGESPSALAQRVGRRVSERGAGVLIYLGDPGRASALLDTLGQGASAPPTLYAPGATLARSVAAAPPAWSGRLVLAFPSLPDDVTPQGRASYERLAASHGLPRVHRAAQLAALAAAELVLEGLERSGRDLRRGAFIEALEGLYDHPTGLTPPLTYGPHRRVGTRGVWMVSVDPAAGRLSPDGWVELR